MNFSMQDTFNLGLETASVLPGSVRITFCHLSSGTSDIARD